MAKRPIDEADVAHAEQAIRDQMEHLINGPPPIAPDVLDAGFRRLVHKRYGINIPPLGGPTKSWHSD